MCHTYLHVLTISFSPPVVSCLACVVPHRPLFSSDVDLFIRFSNSVINDMIFLIDEALIKANQLHIAQVEAQAQAFSAAVRNKQQQKRNLTTCDHATRAGRHAHR